MFGEVVRGQRVRLGMTQEELATRAQLSVRGIGKIESGDIAAPRPRTVRLLAEAFELTGEARDEFCAAAGDQSPAETPAPARQPTIPAQLPADVRAFTGRTAELVQLDELSARTPAGDADPTGAAIGVLCGTAGVGKTALAVHWAQRARHRFPDGQLYVNLRGFDPGGSPVPPAEAVRRFLDAFGVPPHQVPHSFEAQVGLYRSLMADRRVLVVLDNARDAEQVRPLLPGAPGCFAIVTSRNRLSGLVAETAHPVTLDLLTTGEARELLAYRIGPDRVAAEPPAVAEIITECARLPLALSIVAARAASHPTFGLAALAGELRAARGSLDTFTGADQATDARAVFSWSYRQLSPDAARLFRLLGLHPGPDFAVPAAASLAGVTPAKARSLLAELSDAHLVTEQVPGRYTCHDLLRAYAAERAHETDSAGQRDAAVDRLLEHYVHTANAAAWLLQPIRDPLRLTPPADGVAAETFADDGQALAWFTAEHAVLLAVIDHTARTGDDVHTWQLASTLIDFLGWRGHWHDAVNTLDAALVAALRLGDDDKEALVHYLIAGPYVHLGRIADADTHLRLALELYRRCGDQVGQAHAHATYSYLREREGRHGDALEHTEHARDLYQAAGHKRGQARALNNLGWDHAQLGEPERALGFCEQAVRAYEELGSSLGQARAWDSVGYAHHQLGHHAEAVSCFGRSLELFRDLGNRWEEAVVLTHFGDAYDAAGDLESADTAWREGLAILEQLNHPDAEQLRTKLRHHLA
jgi:tetratricopeptide (TPR) repeat protein/transcriptional regulator with XRE-family HTH domain